MSFILSFFKEKENGELNVVQELFVEVSDLLKEGEGGNLVNFRIQVFLIQNEIKVIKKNSAKTNVLTDDERLQLSKIKLRLEEIKAELEPETTRVNEVIKVR